LQLHHPAELQLSALSNILGVGPAAAAAAMAMGGVPPSAANILNTANSTPIFSPAAPNSAANGAWRCQMGARCLQAAGWQWWDVGVGGWHVIQVRHHSALQSGNEAHPAALTYMWRLKPVGMKAPPGFLPERQHLLPQLCTQRH
jgi:hypothetical protein